ncbi:MAG: glycosyltransferase [Alkalinema sp. RU_4_3]|nr:glycosyltransferase [Alkalinema sp. RU_4_3]
MPLISVVIPTFNRPDLLTRAIESALAQTLGDIEVLVIINGPDEQTRSAVQHLNDDRLQILQIPESGASLARMAGVRAATSDWIAFLDDDDSWMPEKLALQWQMAQSSTAIWPIVTSKLIARTPKGDFVRPRRFPREQEPIAEYLLGRNSFFQGEGLIQTSTILAPKALLEQVPFRQIPKHQDWDWLIRAMEVPGAAIAFVPEVLAVWHLEEGRSSVSTVQNWQNSLQWARDNRDRLSRRAYGSFLLLSVGAQTAAQGSREMFWPLLWEAVRLGRPKQIEFLLYLGLWGIPMEQRRAIRAFLTKKRSANEQPA